MLTKITAYRNTLGSRTQKILKSTLSLFFLKGTSITINILLVPITLKLLEKNLFGIWITIFSVINWLNYFDIGLGNGLRNKCASAFAINDKKKLKEYISSAYIFMTIIALLFLIIFFITERYISWSSVFNVQNNHEGELRILLNIVFPLSLLTFVLKLITNILTSNLRPGVSSSVFTISNLFILILFVTFQNYFKNSIIKVGAIYVILPLLIILFYNLLYFSTKYKDIRPSISAYKSKTAKSLFNTGVNFFIIQIAVLVVFQTDNLIITQVLGPQEVTPYNIAFRYFGIILMGFNLVLVPLWSAYTNALENKDFKWMLKTLKFTLILLIPATLLIITLTLFYVPLIKLWIGYNIITDYKLIMGMAIFTFISIWNNTFAYFLNGINQTKQQVITSILAALLNIPLSIILAKIYGNSGVIMATCVCLSFFMIIGPISTYKFFNIQSKKSTNLMRYNTKE